MSTPRAFQNASSACARRYSASASCASMASLCHSSHIAFNSKISSQLRLSNVVFIFLFVRRWAFPHSLETLNHRLRKKSTPKTTFFYFFYLPTWQVPCQHTPVFSKKMTFFTGLRRGTAYFSISTRVSHNPSPISSDIKYQKINKFKTPRILFVEFFTTDN